MTRPACSVLAAVASVRADCVRDGVPVTAETTDIELILVLGEAIIKEFPRQVAAMLSEQRAKFLDKLSAVETERDALLAWQAAVPVAAIDCVYDDARLESEAPEVQAIWMEIGAWLATLPAPAAQP